MSVESVMLSNHLIPCHPLLLLPLVFPSIRVFSYESALCNRWPKYWSFCFSTCPSNDYSGLISFRMDWFDLLAVQGILKSLLQHHSLKASILRCSAFMLRLPGKRRGPPSHVISHPTLTSSPHHWKNHSFDYTNLCWQSNVSAF